MVDCPVPTIVNMYSFQCQNTSGVNYSGRAPKNFTFEGWDGNSWIILDTRINITGYSTGVPKYFSIINNTPYIKYRLNVTENNGLPYLVLSRFNFYNTNRVIRSLSGGNAYLNTDGKGSLIDKGLGAYPTNNEYDKYIVNSSLNGKITPGDDSIWNYLTNYSACIDTARLGLTRGDSYIATASSRTYRCTPNSWTMFSYQTSDAVSNWGFRPVLEYQDSPKSTNIWY
jgi:hypothetical protein